MYCSGKCGRQYRSKIKGWKSHERQWENLRELVLERDNYICQECHVFSMNGLLQVHHIEPLFRGGVNDETNLVTLCPPCLKKAHKNYDFPEM
jgi:5-methylcytosine-specific restriction endonuclease McrA